MRNRTFHKSRFYKPPRPHLLGFGLRVEHLESRQLLAAELSFSSEILQSTTLSLAELAAADISIESASPSDANAKPTFIPSKHDPVARAVGPDLFAVYQAAGRSFGPNVASRVETLSSEIEQSGVLVDQQGDVLIEIIADTDLDSLRTDLLGTGFVENGYFGKILSGSIDPIKLNDLSALKSVRFIRPIYKSVSNVGTVSNQADAAMRSNIARATFNVDGSGVKIGVISDSFDKNSGGGGAAGGIASGNLPGPGNPNGFTIPVQVLEDEPDGPNANHSDEGRAMLELIHDIAPAAELAFHTGFAGPANFAQGILDLAAAGADVIVDDVSNFSQPFFQDGIIAQAANQVVAQGVPFFSSAGNQGRDSYESLYRTDGVRVDISATGAITLNPNGNYLTHDFDPSSGQDNFQLVALAPGGSATLIFQWDQPFASAGGAGAANDMDIFVYDFQTQSLVTKSDLQNPGQDAIEVVRISNTSNQSRFFNIMLAHYLPAGGPTPGAVKYLAFGAGFDIGEFDTQSSTLYGHHQAIGGAGIAAADYRDTPAFGTNPPSPQPSTSAGGLPILFDTAGNRLTTPEVRQQPIVTGPDNTNTSFFIPGNDPDNDGFPNFSGTSAAAPHVAAVAALMMEAAGGPSSLTPAQINTTLQNTAIDMLSPGFDFDTGFGLVNAEAAVATVNNGGGGGNPGGSFNGNGNSSGKFYFTAETSDGQRELFASDGTENNTALLANIAGTVSSNPEDLTLLGDRLIFSALTSSGDRELFVSDGTPSSTKLLKNLAGSQPSKPADFTKVGNQLFFTAQMDNGQRELFVTDGTAAGTRLVENLAAGVASNPKWLTAFNGNLYFSANINANQRELHVSNGTLAGTKPLVNLSGTINADPQELIVVGEELFFTAKINSSERELFKTDGTPSGTILIENLGSTRSTNPVGLTRYGTQVFFTASLANGERELFKSNGTAAGTQIVTNLAGGVSSNPDELTVVDGKLYFAANSSNTQRELFVSTGPSASTQIVKDLNGSGSANPKELTEVDGMLAFVASSGAQRELYRSNGTNTGTVLVKNLAGSQSSQPQRLTSIRGRLLFTALTTDGQRETFTSDLSNAGTALLKNLSGNTSAKPRDFTTAPNSIPLADSFFFTAVTNGGQRELFASDGTFAGTKPLTNIGGSISAEPEELTLVGDTLFFTAITAANQRELFQSDGTPAGTKLVRDLGGSVPSKPAELTRVGNKLYFAATRSDGQRELFVSDGTFAGTRVVENLAGSVSSKPTELVEMGGLLYFAAQIGANQRELHVSDGTVAGTKPIVNISGNVNANPRNLTAVGNTLYFSAVTPGGQRELHKSDGTAAGTVLVENLSGGVSADPQNLTRYGSQVFFTAMLPSGERELFKSNGSAAGTSIVRNLGGSVSAVPDELIAVDGKLFFAANSSANQRELFVTTGSSASTALVKNLNNGKSANPAELTDFNGELAFIASAGVQRELFKSDGTSAGTVLVKNLNDSDSGSPQRLTAIGNRLIFTALDSNGERELYTSDLTNSGTDLFKNLSGSASSRPRSFVLAPAGIASTNNDANSTQLSAPTHTGDVNGDGFVSALDALTIINQLGSDTDDIELDRLDTNNDGRISAADALFVINALAAFKPAEFSFTENKDQEKFKYDDDVRWQLAADQLSAELARSEDNYL